MTPYKHHHILTRAPGGVCEKCSVSEAIRNFGRGLDCGGQVKFFVETYLDNTLEESHRSPAFRGTANTT